MDFIYSLTMILVALSVVLGGPLLLVSNVSNTTQEKTVIMCIENPKQCKKQYDFYKMRDELKEESIK